MFMVIATLAKENICLLYIGAIIRTINSESNPKSVEVNQGTDVKCTRTIAEHAASSYQYMLNLSVQIAEVMSTSGTFEASCP